GLLACYLLLERGRKRPIEAPAVLAAATLGLFLNPGLWDTPRYYAAVFRNEAAKEGVGLWKPLTATAFDVLLIVVAAFFAADALRGRTFRLWEGVAVGGLGRATLEGARKRRVVPLRPPSPAAPSRRPRP